MPLYVVNQVFEVAMFIQIPKRKINKSLFTLIFFIQRENISWD